MWQVKDNMRKDVITINYDATVRELATAMAADEHYEGYAIILKQSKPIGIVTERDIINKVVAQDIDYSQTSVSKIMTSPLKIIDPDEDLSTASQLMTTHNVRKLVVVSGNIMYGIITSRCIFHCFQDYVNRTLKNIMRWIPK